MSIVIFGSINMDLVVRTPRLPGVGETIIGYSFETIPGGKGANQAVACARLGGKTFMVGRVGGDEFGETLKEKLKSAGVNDEFVLVDSGISSGVALIAVDDSAENDIIVIPGANGKIYTADLDRLEQALNDATSLLMQLEIPIEMVQEAARLAAGKGIPVILDPAPARELPSELYTFIDIITPNETEASFLTGSAVSDRGDAEQAAKILQERGTNKVVIKMGGRGVYATCGESGKFFQAIPVTAIDTVAAGDAFNGGLAVALSEGKSFEDAVSWGIAAGALAVTKEGAQPAMPTREELLELMSANSVLFA